MNPSRHIDGKIPIEPQFAKAVQEAGVEFDPSYAGPEIKYDENGKPYASETIYEYVDKTIVELKRKAERTFDNMIHRAYMSIDEEELEDEEGLQENRRFKKWRSMVR